MTLSARFPTRRCVVFNGTESDRQGSNFLLYLERTVGGLEHFLPYMKDYVKTFTNTSITTDQWRDHLFDYFGRQPNGAEYLKKLEQVDWNEVSIMQN